VSPELPEKSKTIGITLNPEARKVIEQIREDTGIPNTEAMTRILEWFAGLDRKFRLAVLSRDEETRRELAADVLSKMSGLHGAKAFSATAEMTPDQMAKAIRFLTDRLESLATGYKRDLERSLKQKGK
jgi:methylphosphotriester-DNA--protein-cysteine methyltransferase